MQVRSRRYRIPTYSRVYQRVSGGICAVLSLSFSFDLFSEGHLRSLSHTSNLQYNRISSHRLLSQCIILQCIYFRKKIVYFLTPSHLLCSQLYLHCKLYSTMNTKKLLFFKYIFHESYSHTYNPKYRYSLYSTKKAAIHFYIFL